MAFQQSDLDEIEKAIGSGALMVKFADREVTYRNMDEMMRARDLIRKELGLTCKTGRIYANFDKGLIRGCKPW